MMLKIEKTLMPRCKRRRQQDIRFCKICNKCEERPWSQVAKGKAILISNFDDNNDNNKNHLGARLQKRKRGRKTTLRREAKRARWRGRWGRWQERNLLIMIVMVMVMKMVTG